MNAFHKTWPITPVAFTLSAAILFFLLVYLPPRCNDTYYEAAFLDKEKLLEKVAPPRIILVGGSNVAFCFDSSLIREAMHVNVINAGLHIGFGIPFMLNTLAKYARAGDMIVICPEYEEFFGLFGGNENLVAFLISYPSALSYVGVDQTAPLLLGARSLLNRKCVGALTNLRSKIFPMKQQKSSSPPSLSPQIYKRSAFNKDGDIGIALEHSAKSPEGFWLPLYINNSGSFDAGVIPALNEFAAFMDKHGVKVVFTYPYLSDSFYRACKPSLLALESRLKSQLKIPIIGNVSDCVLPDECFYDTRYHVLTRYKGTRTNAILSELKLIQSKAGHGR